MRYSAFISYNYRDRKTAIWLHRALENYRVPKRLRGRAAPFGLLGTKLPPAFRDREELAASANLGAAVQQALADSASLIVICTPDGARSRWVNDEIRAFAALGRRDRIRCLIAGGEPNAADPALECLPPALFADGAAEPLAADLRPHQDGRSGARLKLLAGVLDVPFDELRQREAARRLRRLTIVATVASILVLVMAALTVVALISRADAVRQRDVARQRTVTAERTVSFVQSMFDVSDPEKARGSSITAREILDRGADKIRSRLDDEPSVRAQLATTLAEVYGSLGLYRQSDAMIRWSLGIRHDDGAVRAHQYTALGEARARLGDHEGAMRAYARTLALCPGGTAQCGDVVQQTYARVAEAQYELGDDAAAIRWGRRALRADLKASGAGSVYVARDLEDLGKVVHDRGDLAGAGLLFRRALAIRLAAEGAQSPGVSDDYNELGAIAYTQGDRIAAERFFRSRLAVDEKVLGPNHPDVATTLNNLGRMAVERRAFAEAVPLLDRARRIDLAERGATWEDNAFVLSNLALAEAGRGNATVARTLFMQALAVAQMHKHRTLAPIMVDLAALDCAQGRIGPALTMLGQARPIMAETYEDTPWRTAWVDNVRGGCLAAVGRIGEARSLLRASTPIVLAKWPGTTMYGHDAAARLMLIGG